MAGNREQLTTALVAGFFMRGRMAGMTQDAKFQVGDWVRLANGRETTVASQCINGKEVYVKSGDVGHGAGIEKVSIASLTRIDGPTAGN